MKLIALIVVLSGSVSFAAISKKATLDALNLPYKNRLVELKKYPKAIEKLDEVASNSKNKLQTRWRAITSMGQLYPDNSITYLQKYAQSPEWYLRNAAMVAFSSGDRTVALFWAERMLNDKALIVRTSAVQALKKIKGSELKSTLWSKLNDKQNFHRGKSLFIRKHIAELLYRFAEQGEQREFVKLLLDKDSRLHPYAIKALQKITGRKMTEGRTLSDRRQAWISYFKNKNI